MKKVLLSTIIEKTREAVKVFGYNQSTMRHYERYWKSLSHYFTGYGCEVFSEQLISRLTFRFPFWGTGFWNNGIFLKICHNCYIVFH